MMYRLFKEERIGGISDGVFAIAMTLLVLDLKLPELGEVASIKVFNRAVLAQVPHFFSWIISFSVLCKLWLTQHALLDDGQKRSKGFTNLNFVFLAAISFIPFPTSLIAEHSDQPLSIIIFSSTLLVAWIALVAMWRSLVKKYQASDNEREENRSLKGVIILIPIIAITSCSLAFIKPSMGILVWIALPFATLIVRHKRRRPS